MSNGKPVCPACGSTSTYVRQRDGAVCCKVCGHGVKRRGAVQHECPLCRSKQVYYRSKTGAYACRRCGLGQDNGIKGEYLDEMAERARIEYREAGDVTACPVCGGPVIEKLLDGQFTCTQCGFSPERRILSPAFLKKLPPFREIRRDRPDADTPTPPPGMRANPPGFLSVPPNPAMSLPFRRSPVPQAPPVCSPAPIRPESLSGPTLAINGHPLALKQEAGTIWIVVEAPDGGFPFAGPGPCQIPVYEAEFLIDLDLTDPATVAEAWKTVLTRAKIGRDDFLKEFPAKLDGLTPAQVTDLQAKGLLSQRALDRVVLAFLNEKLPGTTPSIGYAAMFFELGLLDRVDEELEAVRETLTRLQQDEDGIPVWTEEKQYRPVAVPDDLPPVEAITVSFDGGKTKWVFVARHRVTDGEA